MPRKVNKKVSPKRRGRPRKTSPRRKRRLNPPESLSRLAARQVIRGDFLPEDINRFMREPVYQEMLDEMGPRSSRLSRGRNTRFVEEEHFENVSRIFKNYKKLQRLGFNDSDAYMTAKLITDDQLDTMVMFINRGINRHEAKDASMYLSGSQIDTFLLLKENGFDFVDARMGAKEFNDSQIDTMITIKNEGFEGKYGYIAVSDLTESEIETMIRLKRGGIEDYYSFEGSDLTESEIETMIRLKREGVQDDSLIYSAVIKLTESQMDNMIRLLRRVHAHFAFKVARNLTDNQIETFLNLKSQGFTITQAYRMAKRFSNRQIDAMTRTGNS